MITPTSQHGVEHTTIKARAERSTDDGITSLTLTLDLASLGVPFIWEYDTVISDEDGELVLLLNSAVDAGVFAVVEDDQPF